MIFKDFMSETLGLPESVSQFLSYALILLLLCFISWLAHFLIKKWVVPILVRRTKTNRFKWDDILVEQKVLQKSVLFVPILILYNGAGLLGPLEPYVRSLMEILLLVQFANLAGALLDGINDIYSTLEVSKEKPIKGFLQVIKILIFVFVFLLVVANLAGTNPFVLLSGLGALLAVFSFIFKDTILGLVAGVLLSLNDMLRIGDWIEMPKYGADGDVVDITMNTVKVRNFDMTITTVPAYALISDSFKNWRGMQNAGARRIKRPVLVDAFRVKFCSEEDLVRYKDAASSRGITMELEEREDWTNLGVYQHYIKEYLCGHPRIHKGLLKMVRQLQPTENGIPVEIYAFTHTVDWEIYENIQSEIMGHVVAMAKEFDLGLFQRPTGNDVKSLVMKENL